MRPFGTWWLASNETKLEQLARQAVQDSLAEIGARLSCHLTEMNRDAARGYLRARCRRPLAQQVAAITVCDETIGHQLHQQITSKATELVVQILLRRYLVQRQLVQRQRNGRTLSGQQAIHRPLQRAA